MFTDLTKFSNYFTEQLVSFVCSSLVCNSETIAAVYWALTLCQAPRERLYVTISQNPQKNVPRRGWGLQGCSYLPMVTQPVNPGSNPGLGGSQSERLSFSFAITVHVQYYFAFVSGVQCSGQSCTLQSTPPAPTWHCTQLLQYHWLFPLQPKILTQNAHHATKMQCQLVCATECSNTDSK